MIEIVAKYEVFAWNCALGSERERDAVLILVVIVRWDREVR